MIYRIVALLLLCTPAAAENLYSFSAMLPPPPLKCDGTDQWFNLKTDISGAGIFPKSPVVIVGTQVWSFFAWPREYFMIGATQPNGDAISPYIFGTANPPPTFFPAGLGFAFDPDRDELHAHYSCLPADTQAAFGFTLFYKKREISSDALVEEPR
jgi:hypothetical protein